MRKKLLVIFVLIFVLLLGIFTIAQLTKKAKLTISVSPSDVRVTITNQPMLQINNNEVVSLKPGKYHVIAVKDGYNNYETDVLLDHDKTLEITLSPTIQAKSDIHNLGDVSLNAETAPNYNNATFKTVAVDYFVNKTWALLTITTKAYQSQNEHIIFRLDQSNGNWVQASDPSEIFQSNIQPSIPAELYAYLAKKRMVINNYAQ